MPPKQPTTSRPVPPPPPERRNRGASGSWEAPKPTGGNPGGRMRQLKRAGMRNMVPKAASASRGTAAAPAGKTGAAAPSRGRAGVAPASTVAGAPADSDIETAARNTYGYMSWALDDPELGKVLRQAATEGWDEARLKGAVFATNWFRTHGTAKIQSEVRKQADEYLVTLTDDDAKRWAMQITTGQVQPVEFVSWAKEQAKSRYGGLSAAIDRGVTVRQYASQYLADAANLLEVPVESLNLKDPKWMRAIEGEVDPKTGERVPMSRSTWDRVLKTDSIYGFDFTKIARTEASAFAAKLQETFGAR